MVVVTGAALRLVLRHAAVKVGRQRGQRDRAKALEQAQKPIQLSLDQDGKLFLGDTVVPMADLPLRLAAIADSGGDTPPQIYLRADTSLDYGEVMRVMGELNRAGLNRVSLVTVTGGESNQ